MIQGFKCEIEDIKDRNCEDECARRQREFDIDYNVLNALYEAIEIFEKRNLNVMEIINYGVNNPTSFIDVLDAHFDEEMGGVIKEKSINAFNLQYAKEPKPFWGFFEKGLKRVSSVLPFYKPEQNSALSQVLVSMIGAVFSAA